MNTLVYLLYVEYFYSLLYIFQCAYV
jgi:hypothetical protein